MKSWYYSFLLLAVWSHETTPVESFLHAGPNTGGLAPQSRATRLSRYSFFKDMLDKAFDNDSQLSKKDKLKGMLEDPNDTEDLTVSRNLSPSLTATQEKWRRSQAPTTTTVSLQGTVAEMDLYLTGVPNKDPSSDLFGGKENISSRDRKVGLQVPEEPTVNAVCIEFLPDNKCRCATSTSFTTADAEGDWRLSEDGSQQVRFRIPVSGYSRTVQTKGSIQKIYWSEADETSTQTSTSYTINAGWMYGEAVLTTNARGDVQWNDGILKVELSMGLLGAASRMVPCGKFVAKTSAPAN
jgi:hypothetical protein